ncbi:hypothetical protein AgCh_033817 [Apium graveolens]
MTQLPFYYIVNGNACKDTDSDHNNNEDMDQMDALLVKSFKKMVYKNLRKGRIFSKKRKPRAEKKEALISRKRNWDDSSNSDDGVNYALMEKADVEDDNAELKSIHEEGTISAPRSNLITDKSEQVHTNSVNIGLMTQKQLKKKLKDLHMKEKRKRSRKNRGYHVNFYEEHYEIVMRKDLVRGLPNAVFTPGGLFDSCQKAKQRKTSFKSKTESSILEP